jgi:hypothetical protein
MRTIVFALMLSLSSLTTAQVLEVNIWKSLPGQNQLTIQYGQEAVAINNKLGGNASIGVDLAGRMHFVLAFENWAAWAKHTGKLQASKEWGAMLERFSKNPSAELEDNYLLDTPAAGADGNVYEVYVFQPVLGRGGDLFRGGMEAKAIHEKAGANVTIHADQLGNMHYVLNFDSWDDWGKFRDTPNPAFQAFMQEFSKDPAGRMIKVYTAANL